MIRLVIKILFMISLQLDGVSKMESSTGQLETLGEHTGANQVSSELLEEQTILLLNLIVLGLHQRTLGLQTRDTKILKLRLMTKTTKTQIQRLYQKLLSLIKREVAESKKHSLKVAKSHQLFIHGKNQKLIHFQTIGIGEILKEETTYLGIRINIFQYIVDHAGLKDQLLLLLIDLMFFLRI